MNILGAPNFELKSQKYVLLCMFDTLLSELWKICMKVDILHSYPLDVFELRGDKNCG